MLYNKGFITLECESVYNKRRRSIQDPVVSDNK